MKKEKIKKQPLVSIVTPSYNCENYIKYTIESVLNQTYENWEMIIVDDISTDKTVDIIKKYQKKDKRIKLIILDTKGGASVARNRAIKEAKGKYIAFLDSDDVWYKEKLEKQITFMEENNIDFSYTDYDYIDGNNNSLNRIRICPKKVTYTSMLLGNSVGCLTVIYNCKKTGLIQIPKIDKRNDYALWCVILKKLKTGFKYNEVLSSYRKTNLISLSNGRKKDLLKYHYKLHHNINKFNFIKASFFTFTNTIWYLINKILREKKVEVKQKIGIIGHFAINQNKNDGQTVKTHNLYRELERIYGKNEIKILDTFNWKKHPIKLVLKCFQIMKNCKNVIILPAKNGIRVFVPLLNFIKHFWNSNLIYAVVGGWLPDVLLNRKNLLKQLKKFDIILVETLGMKKRLNQLSLENVEIMHNFKTIQIVDNKEVRWIKSTPMKVCTFSRVIKEKGIQNAINAINIVNNKYKKELFVLDVYGPVAEEYKTEFFTLLENNKNIVMYKGSVDYNMTTQVLKNYSLLLFPTYYEGEGFAGTIIDAFSSGVPVVASNWKYNGEIVKNYENGFLFNTNNDEELSRILEDIYNDKYDMLKIKKNCLKTAKKYVPEKAIMPLIKYLDGE